jgi:NADPH-dependent ferric siderophore reductase
MRISKTEQKSQDNVRDMNISKLLDTEQGQIVISIILGLGLASAFRYSCKNGNCIVIKGPKMSDVKGKYFRLSGNCYQYTPYVVECDK